MPQISRRSFFALAAAIPAHAADTTSWPQWRGPDRTGITTGEAWPDRLDGLRPLWRVEMDKGYPGPIVTGGMVYVAETANTNTEVIRALDRKTGKEMWRASWPGKLSVPFFAKKNGDWIRSTPTTDGKTLYVGGMEEVLVALDAKSGKENWRVDFPKRFLTPKPDFGFASSPLLDGNAVYVQAANSTVKLDKKTGATMWRSAAYDGGMMESGAFSSPTFATIHGRRQLLVQTRTKLNGLDTESGDVLWSVDVPNYRGMNILTPLPYGNMVFTSSYRMDSFLFRIGQDNGKFRAEEVWRNKAKGYMSTPVRLGDHVYMHLQNQRFLCIDLRNGETCWTSEPFGQYWSMAVRNDKILALDERGVLNLVRANPSKFELLDSKEISGQPCWGHLAIAGNDLYVRELTAIAAYRWESAPLPARPSED
ncbi:MAG: PQQ-like beta-propeller repeat protein [Bryobacterales bacterium]|nr:PQQ-like beta-propeller repeat protein [Bryobacterales bacterium]